MLQLSCKQSIWGGKEVAPMQLNPVSSSRMVAVGWENNVMRIQFKNGTMYDYYDVSYNDYLSFINSPSLGSALHQLDKVHRYSPV